MTPGKSTSRARDMCSPAWIQHPAAVGIPVVRLELRRLFVDDPVVIFTGERMRWRNIDGEEHNVVTDAMVFPEFATTGLIEPGGERSFVMNTVGTTKIHCTIHPQMVGTLIVRER